MKDKRLILTFMVLVTLLISVGGTVAQDPGAPGGDPPSGGKVSPRISYQAVLKEGDTPVSGDRDMVFRLYSDGACSAQVGGDIPKPGVEVRGGLFDVALDADHEDLNGQGLWLGVEVEGTHVVCQEVLPVPYALSLRPGASVSGTVDGSSLQIVNSATSGEAYGLRGESHSPSGRGVFGHATAFTGGYGVYGQSDSLAGYGVYGASHGCGVYGESDGLGGSGVRGEGEVGVRGKGYRGVYGESESAGGYGVYGTNSAGGYAGYFDGDVAIDGHTAWHAGNDGDGSGLDADRLDGQEGSYYQPKVVIAQNSVGFAYLPTAACNTLQSVSINTTGPGWVIVEANTGAFIDHASGVEDHLWFGIGSSEDDCGLDIDQVRWSVPSQYPTSSSYSAFTVRAMFYVGSAGSYTYYLGGYMSNGADPDDRFITRRLIAVFYPD
jgi:hypothetical protein